jgi:hypothetical protein
VAEDAVLEISVDEEWPWFCQIVSAAHPEGMGGVGVSRPVIVLNSLDIFGDNWRRCLYSIPHIRSVMALTTIALCVTSGSVLPWTFRLSYRPVVQYNDLLLCILNSLS